MGQCMGKRVEARTGVVVDDINCCVAVCAVDPDYPWTEQALYNCAIHELFRGGPSWDDLTPAQKNRVHQEVRKMERVRLSGPGYHGSAPSGPSF